MSSVLEESCSGLGRRTGLSEAEVKGLVSEVARAVLAGSPSPSTALSLYLTGQSQHCWGETHTTLVMCSFRRPISLDTHLKEKLYALNSK